MKHQDKSKILNQALNFHHNGDLDRANSLYLQILSIDPDDFNANHLHGCILSQKKKYKEAIRFLIKSVELNCDNYEANNNLAIALKNDKDFDKAQLYFENAIKIDPRDYRAHYNLGNLFAQTEDYQEAIKSFASAFECDSNFLESKKRMGEVYQFIYQKGHDEENLLKSEKCFIEILEKNPNDISSLTLLGLAKLWKGDIDESHQIFQKTHKHQYENQEILNKEINRILNNKNALCTLIKHEYEQLTHIDNDIDEIRNPKFSKEYYDLLKKYADSIENDSLENHNISTDFMKLILRPLYNKAPKNIIKNLINTKNNLNTIENQYNEQQPEIVVIDNFLTDEALFDIQKYCRNANIFKYPYEFGYVGAFLTKGMSNKFFLKLSEDMRLTYKRIFKNYKLTQAWIFKYDHKTVGTRVHSDQASINVNFWIAPNDSNLDTKSGGLVIWNKLPPKSWEFSDYNSIGATKKINQFLKSEDVEKITVPHKENRCVIFNSKLFHKTDNFAFKESYKNRRINVTLLFD